MHVAVVVVAVVALLFASVRAQIYNPCQTVGSCCFNVNFVSTPGIDGQSLAQGYVLPASYSPSPWGSGSLGLEVVADPRMTRPGTNGWLYPLALLNASGIGLTADWHELSVPGAGNAAVFVTTVTPSIAPLRNSGTTTMHVKFQHGNACLQSISLLRTWSLDYRMGASLTLSDSGGAQLASNSYPWSLQVQGPWINQTYTTSNVADIQVSFTGFGYGALAGFSVCYPQTSFDQCGVCGGNGSQCSLGPQTPVAGDACFNVSMSNPVCQPGIYNSQLQCIPTALGLSPEVCNGVDDDCDGVIDGGAPVVNLTCGVGACQRVVYGCTENGTGTNLICTPGTPVPEICNGIDDDCNGIVDDPPVCAQPVDGVVIVPLAYCVEGRLAPASTQCYAHFGWWNSDAVFNVTRQFGTDMNSLAMQPNNVSVAILNIPGVPSFFVANGSVQDAFRVPIQCQNGAAIWSLGDGEGHYLEAAVYAASSPPCENYIGRPETLTRPISIFVDSPCVTQSSGTCSVALGYYNPNYGAPAYYVPPSASTNSFSVNGVAQTTAPLLPPASFFQQRVREAALVSWPCTGASDTFTWTLQTAGMTHKAIASIASSSLCQ